MWSGLVRESRLRWRRSERRGRALSTTCRWRGSLRWYLRMPEDLYHRLERILSILVFMRAVLGSSGFGRAYVAQPTLVPGAPNPEATLNFTSWSTKIPGHYCTRQSAYLQSEREAIRSLRHANRWVQIGNERVGGRRIEDKYCDSAQMRGCFVLAVCSAQHVLRLF